jgi:hypothetical protein
MKFESQLQIVTAAGVPPFTVNQTAAVINLNSDLLDGQHGSYFEGRDTTAIGFSGGSLTLTRTAGNLSVSLDGRYLALTGGTVSGVVRINNQLQVGQNTNGTATIDAYGGFAWFGRDSNSTGIRIDGSANVHMTNTLNVVGAVTQNGNQVLHAGNYNSYSPTLGGTGATGTWPISITGSAVQLNGQAASYYENRDTTAVGFSGGTLTLTRAAGNLTVGLDGRYLPLTGGVLTGALTGTTAAFGGDVSLNAKVSFGNRAASYSLFHGGAQDLAWKKIADITFGTSLYSGATFKVEVIDANTNFGANADCKPMTFFVSCRRSGGVLNDLDSALVFGPVADYVRAVKTATGVYELQIRQIADWMVHTFIVEVISQGAGTVTYVTGTPPNGSTTGTIYLPTTGGYTQRFTNLSVAAASSFAGQITSTVATGTAPLSIASTTLVTNLNADLLDGQHGSFYQNAGNLNAGTLPTARLPAFTGGDVTSTAGSTALTLGNSGVTAGTYRSVTVDGKGRVTAGTNPTTLSGYGITDAMYQVDPNGFTQGDINGSGNMQRLWGTDSVQDLIAFRPPTTVEYTTDNVNWIATTISNDVFSGKVFGQWAGFNMNVGSNIGAWTKVRMTWVNFGYHFFSHFTMCHSTNGHSMNFVFYKSDLNGVFSSEAYRLNGISSWPGYTFTSHVNVSGWWDTRDVRMVFELNGNNGPSGYPNNAISIGHIGIMGGYSSFNRVYDWDGNRNITLYGNLTLPGNVTAPRFISNIATGTAPFAVTSTTAVTNLNADLLDGQHGSYFENRDTTAVGFSGGTLTLTRAAGNLTVGLDGRYLPLTGGTLTGALAVNNDSGISTTFDSGASTSWYRGWGWETNRGTAYLRPVSNRTQDLYLGASSINSQDWKNVNFYASGTFAVNNNAILHAGNYSGYSLFSGQVSSGGNNGFANATWSANVRNPIWYFGNATTYGISYFQGSAGIGSADTIGIHPNGTATAAGSAFAVTPTASYVNNNVVLHAGNVSTYALPIAGGTITGNLTINGTLSEGGYQAFPERVYTINLTGQSASNFYPIVINASPGADVWHHRFSLEMPSLGGGSAYNMDHVHGEARGGGSSDQTAFYRVFHNCFDNAERSVLGLWRGSSTFYGIVLYVRGGQTYYVRTTSRSVAGFTAATTQGDATFAIKNAAGADVSGTSAAIAELFNLINTPQGFHSSYNNYIGGTQVVTNTGTWGISISGSAAQLNGQAASYYENRDTTAVGFSGGTLTLTRAAGNLTASLDGRYLPLTGGTLTGGLVISSSGTSQLQINSPAGTQGLWVRAGYDSDGTATPIASALNVMLQSSGSSSGTFSIVCGNTKVASISTGAFNSLVALQQGGNQVVHAGNFATYGILRSLGQAANNNVNWNTLGNVENTTLAIVQETFNQGTGTGNTNFPTSATYKYGTLLNFGGGAAAARAQIYISHAGNDFIFRGGWGDSSWQTWNKCLTDQNYSAYALPLSGGTLTGALSGTSASFSGALSSGGNAVLTVGNYSSYAVDNTKRMKQFFWDNLSASTTQARRFEIARIGIDQINWNSVGSMEIEVSEDYYDRGLKKKYVVWYGYNVTRSGVVLTEMSGAGTNSFQVTLGSESPVSGNHYYVPVYVDVKYYGIASVRMSTSRQITSSGTPPVGYTYINPSPTPTNIADFTPDSTVNMSNAASAWQVGGNVIVHAGNYTTYTVTKTGGGASGSWGINITGSSASCTGNAATATNVAWSGITSKPTTFSGYGISDLVYGSSGSRNVWTITNWNQQTYPNAHFLSSEGNTTNAPSTDFIYGLQTSFHRSGSAYRTQMVTELYSNPVSMWVRNSRDSDVWTSWAKLVHSLNYTDYTVTKTGAGASGSWGINITGSSASCSGSAAQLNGQAASYYENRDITAVGFASGTLTLTRAAGNLSVSLDGRYLTGNQTISLTGAVTGSGTTSIATTLANSTVTYAKIQNVGAASVLGNSSASVSQAPQEITFGNLNNLLSGAAKAWVTFNENPTTGAITINASFNVSSITRINYGQYRVNFSTAFGDANYAISGTIGFESNGGYLYGGFLNVARSATPKTTTYCEVTASYGDGNTYNARYVHVVIDR